MSQWQILQPSITDLLPHEIFTGWFFSVWHWNMKQLTPMKGSPNAALSWALALWKDLFGVIAMSKEISSVMLFPYWYLLLFAVAGNH